MRYTHYRKLLEVERQQRGDRHGWRTRMRQLMWLTALLLGMYITCTYNVWRHPRPVHHIWIDNVLVEVVEVNWIDSARTGLLYSGASCGVLWVLLHLTVASSAAAVAVTATEGRTTAAKRLPQMSSTTPSSSLRNDISTIAVPAWARRRPSGVSSRAGSTTPALQSTTRSSVAPVRAGSSLDTQRPMRSDRDLDWFLAYEAAQRQQQKLQQRRSAEEEASEFTPPRLRRAGTRIGGRLTTGLEPAPLEAAVAVERDAIAVSYERRPPTQRHGSSSFSGGGGGGGNAATQAAGLPLSPSPSTLMWPALGIHHLDEALQRTREWISDVCRHLVTDVEQCDRWFSAQQIDAYGCHHSLQELLPAPLPQPPIQQQPFATTGFGAAPAMRWGSTSSAPFAAAGAPITPPSTAAMTKLAALIREKTNCRRTQQDTQELDTALRYDQRLALEARLDVAGTFPSAVATRPPNAELTACREYVLNRLRTFAKQRFLVSYNGGGGDDETWRSGFPCDAHLLLHVLRTSVKGLRAYVRLGYQTGMQSHDLALCVGDTGEPYFYVRLRQGGHETVLPTCQGPTSLMEAVLAFAAVIHLSYHDVYGGVRGTVDLSEVGLLRVVTEGRRSTWDGDDGKGAGIDEARGWLGVGGWGGM